WNGTAPAGREPPTGVPFQLEPCAWAQSSINARPCFAQIEVSASRSAGWPARCTATMARVRAVIAATTAAGSMQYVAGSMSTSTGTALTHATAEADAKNV